MKPTIACMLSLGLMLLGVGAYAQAVELVGPQAMEAPMSDCCGAAQACVVSAEMEALTPAPAATLCDVQPFSREVRYMSLAGYQRWQHRLLLGRWQPLEDTERQVRQELALCPIR